VRDTSTIEPAWPPGAKDPRDREAGRHRWGGALLPAVLRVATFVAPHALRWVEGRAPRLRFAWGAWEYQVRRDGIHTIPREESGWEPNPKGNYNRRFERRPAPNPLPVQGTEEEAAAAPGETDPPAAG
jgi:hypothetical protein